MSKLKFDQHYLTIKDFFLSQETFEIYKDSTTEILKTLPQPDDVNPYYQTEDYLSHSDKSNSFFEKCYQFAKRSNLKAKIKLVNSIKSKASILDIGAGAGDLVLALTNSGHHAIGVEPNQAAREVAFKKGVKLHQTTTELEDDSFDIITMYHVLEHVPDIEQQILELERLLKPEGMLIVALPNYQSYDAKVFKQHWAGYDVPRHLFHFNQNAVRNFFSDKFKLQETIPLWWDAFYVSILSARYQKRILPFFFGLMIGAVSNLRAIPNKNYSSLTYVLKRK